MFNLEVRQERIKTEENYNHLCKNMVWER